MIAPEFFKLSSLLLQYPGDELLAARGELLAECGRLGRRRPAKLLREACERWVAVEPSDLRRSYVETFDFRRRSSLYLTFHSYGDRRERGSALIALKQRYDAAGFDLDGPELPDFLPLILEFCALAPEAGLEVLLEHRESLEVLRAELGERESLWAPIIAAICATLPSITRRQRARVERMAAEGPPTEQVGLEPYPAAEAMPPPEPVAGGGLR